MAEGRPCPPRFLLPGLGAFSHIGGSVKVLLKGHFIRAGKAVVAGNTLYDFNVAGRLRISVR